MHAHQWGIIIYNLSLDLPSTACFKSFSWRQVNIQINAFWVPPTWSFAINPKRLNTVVGALRKLMQAQEFHVCIHMTHADMGFAGFIAWALVLWDSDPHYHNISMGYELCNNKAIQNCMGAFPVPSCLVTSISSSDGLFTVMTLSDQHPIMPHTTGAPVDRMPRG